MNFDFVIKNGVVVDPAQNIEARSDVAVAEGRIAALGEGIDAEGCYVLPGLIDFHLHAFDRSSELAVCADAACLPNGVTAAVDAGSCGVANCDAFQMEAHRSHTRLKCFINVCGTGLLSLRFHEETAPRYYDAAKLRAVFEKYPDTVIGLKIRSSRELVGELGFEPLERTLQIAAEIGCPVAVHATNPPGENGCSEILSRLRKGDIFCHVFHGKGDTIIREGRVSADVLRARERGVIFDAANGANHFDLAVARAALADGFLPDVISTDLTSKTLYQPSKVMSLPFVMSKYLNLGVSLRDVVERTTAIPARLIGEQGRLGTLRPGAAADVAVFRKISRATRFSDHKNEDFIGELLLKPQLTMLGGEIIYRQVDF